MPIPIVNLSSKQFFASGKSGVYWQERVPRKRVKMKKQKRQKRTKVRNVWEKMKALRCQLLLLPKKKISLGKYSTFGRGTVFYTPHRINIGQNVYIGKYCTLNADIQIDDDVLIGNAVGLIGRYDHDFSCVGKTIKESPWIGDADYNFKGKNEEIVIERDSWVGYGAVILTGVRVGRGAIVAAGSVVVRDVAPYSIVAGNPAKAVSKRFTEEQIARHEKRIGGDKE